MDFSESNFGYKFYESVVLAECQVGTANESARQPIHSGFLCCEKLDGVHKSFSCTKKIEFLKYLTIN